jgi:hypothetical protein
MSTKGTVEVKNNQKHKRKLEQKVFRNIQKGQKNINNPEQGKEKHEHHTNFFWRKRLFEYLHLLLPVRYPHELQEEEEKDRD